MFKETCFLRKIYIFLIILYKKYISFAKNLILSMFFAVFCFSSVGLYQVSTYEVCIEVKKCIPRFSKTRTIDTSCFWVKDVQ